MSDAGVQGYLELLRTNRSFTKLWIAQFISMIGDWMMTIPLLGLIFSLTGSGFDAGLLIVFTLLPYVFLSPFGGVIADRYNRKAVMVLANFASSFLVLGFLFIHKPSQMGILYLLVILTEVAGAFYAPASAAAFPNIVESSQLYSANVLSGSTWGVALAVGSAIGGFVSKLFGREICFAANAASFIVSGLIILTIRRPFSSFLSSEDRSGGLKDLKEGFGYVKTHPLIKKLLAFQACLGFATGAVLLYSVFPVKVFHDGDLGMGILYGVRGIANISGKFVVRGLVAEDLKSLWSGMSWSGFCIGFFYIVFSFSPGLSLACLAVLGAHMANAAFWVLASFFLQRYVSDEFLGRIASLDTAVFTFCMAFSTLSCGFFVEHASPRLAAALFGLLTLLFTLLISMKNWGELT